MNVYLSKDNTDQSVKENRELFNSLLFFSNVLAHFTGLTPIPISDLKVLCLDYLASPPNFLKEQLKFLNN